MMSDRSEEEIPATPCSTRPVLLQAEPEPLEIDLCRTAVLVIDMQNAYASKGGMFDLAGMDISRAQAIIEPVRSITAAARAAGVKVVYLAFRYSPDLSESGGADSPLWRKHVALRLYREHPEWRDRLLVRGTWGADFVDRIKPQEGDAVIEKPRFSAFFGTNLDAILSADNTRYLVFVGLATNICVQASIIDAPNFGYFPILVSDATANTGPPSTQQATIFNVKSVYGWVSTTAQCIEAMRGT